MQTKCYHKRLIMEFASSMSMMLIESLTVQDEIVDITALVRLIFSS